jgi:hypothetical protein
MNKIVTPTTEQLEMVLAEVGEGTVSAYGIAKILNRVLVANGEKEVRSQMMYNYAKNGMIVRGEKVAGETLREFTPLEVAEFICRFVLRNGGEIKFTAPENPNQLELELGIEG